MSPTRVLFLINNLQPGGAQRYLVDVVGRLSAHDVDWRVVSLGEGNAYASELDENVVSLGMTKAQRDPRALVPLLRELMRFRPHVLHTHLRFADVIGQLLGRACGVPAMVTTAHGTVEWPRTAPGIRAWLEDACLRHADAVIAVSEEVKSFLHTRRGMPENKIVVLPGGIALGPFLNAESRRAATRDRLGIAHDTFMIVCTAHFRPEKRHDLLLDAFRAFLDTSHIRATLVLVGRGGILEKEVRLRIDALGLASHVIVTGGDKNTVAGILGAADAFTLLSESEGTSLAVAEAMAAGLPLILPLLPHFTRQADASAECLFVAFGDAQGWGHAARRLATDDALRRRLGRAARTRAVERYDIERHVERLRAIYATVLAHRAPRHAE